MAGIPLSRANCTCASCSSLGAKDIAITSLSNRNPPKLPTPHPTSKTTRVCFPHAIEGSACVSQIIKPLSRNYDLLAV